MSVDTENQSAFDRLMAGGRELGRGMADVVVAANPAPWREDWFAGGHQSVIDASGAWYRDNRPDYPPVLVANLQVRVSDGFEARIRELADAGALAGGTV